jgi:hypothetical protein
MQMKRRGWVRTGTVLCLLGLILVAGAAGADVQVRTATPVPQDYDTDTRMDVNNLDMFVTNQGSFAYNIGTGNSGLIFPKGTNKAAIYAAGIWIGAKVDGQVRTSVAEYSNTYGPGPILPNGRPADPTNPRYQAYKITLGDGPTSADYANWPRADGAPVVGPDSLPGLIGDQTIWSVFNDSSRVANNAASAIGLGVEIQQTTFAFNRTGSLGDVIFMKYLIINKGANTLVDTYVSIWSDPDLGGSSDDLVGCDTTLSLGYCYNATNTDNIYASTPPAVGFDFFQGPIGDDGRELPMTSFNKYINGTDPDSPAKAYYYQQGLAADGATVIDPTTNLPSKFMHAGDPTKATGWLDSNPADRRMMLSSGPFTMAPGDTQTVVCAVIVGQGKDRLTSITALKFNDKFAQAAFDANFDLPSPPPRPVVNAARVDNEIVLYWGDTSETTYDEPGYVFEGYNVYMGESVAGPWKRVVTYDLSDNLAFIFDDQFDLETGVVINKPVQFGTDSGIRRRVMITTDENRGGTLRNGRSYFFGVTAYGYGDSAAAGLKTLENSIDPIELVPQQPSAGTILGDGGAGDTLNVVHAGTSDGRVYPILLNPAATTGETYEVTFDADSVGAFWDLKTTGGRTVLAHQRNQTGDEVYAEADGILWKVVGAIPGFKRNTRPRPMVDEIMAPDSLGVPQPVPPDKWGGPGNDLFLSIGSTGTYIIAVGGGDGTETSAISRFVRSEANNSGWDIIMKWDDDPDNYAWWSFNDGQAAHVPFGLYQRNPADGEDVRLIPVMNGTYTPGVFDFAPDSVDVDAVFGYLITDWIYVFTIDPNAGTYADFVADARDNGVIDVDVTGEAGVELIARMVIGSAQIEDDPETPDVNEARPPVLPATGTVIQFSTTKPNTPLDKFTIATRGVKFDASVMKNDLSLIRVVPNPYFAHSAYEMNQFERVVKFTRMPPMATVRIFNLAGDLVRTLEKDNPSSSFLAWDLQTDRRLPVGSGVYIYHIEGKNAAGAAMGTTTGRMAIFVEKERLNTF